MKTRTKSSSIKPHCVFDKKTGKKVACFRTAAEARAHLGRLNGTGGLKGKSGGCGCGK